MKISTRTRYGLRALIDLASRQSDGPVMLRAIAESEGLSKKYLDNIFTSLRLAGLLRTIRGAHGGYLLNKDASEITVLDVVTALEGDISPVDCLDHPGLCDRSDNCVTRELWKDLRASMEQTLGSRTIQQLVDRAKELQKKGKTKKRSA